MPSRVAPVPEAFCLVLVFMLDGSGVWAIWDARWPGDADLLLFTFSEFCQRPKTAVMPFHNHFKNVLDWFALSLSSLLPLKTT